MDRCHEWGNTKWAQNDGIDGKGGCGKETEMHLVIIICGKNWFSTAAGRGHALVLAVLNIHVLLPDS